MTPPRERLIAVLFNARNRLRLAIDDAFRPLGITDATWRTLFYLEQAGNGVSQRQLAEIMGIEGPTLVRLLDNLQARGLIERRESETDRRAKSVHLTTEAGPLLAELHRVARDVRARFLAGISEKDVATCVAVLERIRDVADRDVSP